MKYKKAQTNDHAKKIVEFRNISLYYICKNWDLS